MTEGQFFAAYFDWMFDVVCDREYQPSYRALLMRLDACPFRSTNPRDRSRAVDGLDLRYRFARETSVSHINMGDVMAHPCSVLEMILALAIRCEEHIMEDEAYGDRTRFWFWSMINSLGLSGQKDGRYNELYVDYVLERFLDLRYSINGSGGLFTLRHPKSDMRETEIWYQMHLYLEEYIEEMQKES